MTTTPVKTDWFYRLMAGYTLLHVTWMLGLIYDLFTHPLAPDPILGSTAYRLFIVLVFFPLALIVTILVLRRTPGNVTGLCLLLWSVLILGQAVPKDSPFYFYNLALNTGWTGLWLLALYFPNGRAAPQRFERWIRGISALAILFISTWAFFQPTLKDWNAENPTLIEQPNPLFIPALKPLQPVANVLEMGSLVLVLLTILPSLYLRYRSSSEKERLQIKWLVWTYGVIVVSAVALAPTGLNTGDQYRYGVPGLVVVTAWGVFITLAPYIAIGNAILRHRLYEIDVIIRRTLVYSLLTGLLGLVFFGLITVLQSLFSTISNQQSTISIVLSTLAIAALFNPLRKRIQDFIDRRFYRRKYDAEQALAEFAAAARSETDLEMLSGKMTQVVSDTLQPEFARLWLARKQQPQMAENGLFDKR